jgi:hypothetical protein
MMLVIAAFMSGISNARTLNKPDNAAPVSTSAPQIVPINTIEENSNLLYSELLVKIDAHVRALVHDKKAINSLNFGSSAAD